jgi:gamma-glutamyltranspeptidase/glutathione hydrolase
MVETTKRAFALRAYELGDPDFHAVRSGVFLSTGAIQQTAGQVSQAKRATAASAIGKVRVQATDRNDTSHFGILLANGDAVACTQTINLRFGSGLVAGRTGVVLNNEMDDFSALPGVPNSFGLIGAEANSIAPRKRPLSSMTPTLVIRDGKTVGVFGTPGGSTIITTTYQSIINVVEHGWGVKKALAFPRLHHQWFPDKIFFEKGRLSEANQAALMALGHRLSPSRSIGNAMAIWKDVSGKIEAAADPRGEGTSQVR